MWAGREGVRISIFIMIDIHNDRYLVKNLDWLEEVLGEGEDDYFLFDCPGTIC